MDFLKKLVVISQMTNTQKVTKFILLKRDDYIFTDDGLRCYHKETDEVMERINPDEFISMKGQIRPYQMNSINYKFRWRGMIVRWI